MKPMRILIVPSWYPTTSRSINGIFIREQADALSALHEVRMLFLDVLPRHTKRKAKHEVSRSRGYPEELIEVPNIRFVWQFVYLMYMARALWRLRRTFDPDIVHTHIAIPAGWGAVMLRRLVGKPIVLTENSSEFDSWLKRPGLRWMANRSFSGADLVIAVSEGQRQRIETTFGRKKGLVIVPNIVNVERFTTSPLPNTHDGYRLLFVGLMDTDQKGVHVLLDALATIVSQSRLSAPLHVDIIGGGSLQPAYEAQAKRLNIE
ncbi:MAG: glycosyltransferase, partial [Chloroflexota bacterium]